MADKIEELVNNLKPMLNELIDEMKKQKIPYLQTLKIKNYEVIIKKQDFEIPDFPPPKCDECGYQMTYNDYFKEDGTYFCPDCGTPVER